jgi:hypothetical protein
MSSIDGAKYFLYPFILIGFLSALDLKINWFSFKFSIVFSLKFFETSFSKNSAS